MNIFVVAGGILWMGAAVQAYYQGNKVMVVVSLAYSIAQFALSIAK